jgi:hypothetical protein
VVAVSLVIDRFAPFLGKFSGEICAFGDLADHRGWRATSRIYPLRSAFSEAVSIFCRNTGSIRVPARS